MIETLGHVRRQFIDSTNCVNGLTPISPPVVKSTDLFPPVVESKRRTTASDKRRITAVPFSAVFVSSAGSHPEVGMDPNTY